MCLSYILIYDNTFRDPPNNSIQDNNISKQTILFSISNILRRGRGTKEYRRIYLLHLLPKVGERKNGSDKDLGNPKNGSGGGVISGHFDTNLKVEVSF